ncbi:MAG: adenylate kinase [Clostridiales bacterium]|nr:adenylate kinase [Clostridiales bacterium]
MRLVLLGPVGSGKGTQAKLISERYNVPHISTGEIFRWNIQNNTELGQQAKKFVDAGELVPEELTIKIVEDKLASEECKNGFILDGFPRNLVQAKALEKMATIDKALLIDLEEEEIIKRLSSRRMCRACGNSTSVDWLVDGKCEKCGAEVYIRDDDKPEVIKNRLKKQAVPQDVVEFYKNKNVFSAIHATDEIEKTYKLVDEVLKTI